MEIQVAVSKTNKYASLSSGDTVEVIERPHGGISVVMVDGQSSGPGAKAISNIVTRKVIALLAEGVRDGAAARAASDTLFTERRGKVSATLNILSADLQSFSLVITRNNPTPLYIIEGNLIKSLSDTSLPIGIYRNTRPTITEIPLSSGLLVVAFTDGIIHAGSRNGLPLNLEDCLEDLLITENLSPQIIADSLLSKAFRLDEGRPVDDISVVVMAVLEHKGDDVRRMSVRVPIRS